MNALNSHDARQVFRDIAPFAQPIVSRSVVELAITIVPFVLLWIATWAALANGYWLGLLLTVPAGGFLLRLFIIQHDCGHGSLFRSRRTNDWVGRALSVLTLTPYDSWRKAHAKHHATSGNLEKRGAGDIDTLTLSEYRSMSRLRRLIYRSYRHPLVLFGVGPAFTFLLRHRLPLGSWAGGWRTWLPTMSTNAAILAVAGLIAWKIGLGLFLAIHLPIALIAATGGIWLFYVQHQFEQTKWDRDAEWSFHDAALYGSSYYTLPAGLRWITGDIGIHHVHHLACRIPFYRLSRVLAAYPALATINRMGLRESLATIRLTLWDDERRRLCSFAELRRA